MKLTTNLNLKKPDYTDPVDIQDINSNMDTIDSAIQSKANSSQVLTNVPANAKFTDTNTITTINGKTGAISKADITALGIPAQDTVYSHPSTHPATMISLADTGDNFTATNVEGAMSELFMSVSSGKGQIATAITDKGVTTNGSDSFSTMATKIGQIDTDPSGDATAIAGDLLSGKTAYAKGNKLTGTIPLKSAQTYTPGTSAQTISSGQYLNGTQTISPIVGTATRADVLSGKTFNSASAGINQTGTMPNNGTQTFTPSDSTQSFGAGYYSGIIINARPSLTGNATTSQVLSGRTFYSNSYTRQTGTYIPPKLAGIEWTQRTSGFGGTTHIYGVGYGQGMFVAVGGYANRSDLATSTDGITWTQRTSSFGTNSINDVGYGQGMFVAVGINGKLATSTDGITWTQRTSGFSTTINGVAYGKGMFVAVGGVSSSGDLATSTNGTSWTQRTSSFSTTIRDVAYGKGMFVAVGNSGKLATSTDGITWTQRTSGFDTTHIYGVGYGQGMFVAVGASGKLATSTNGITWTQRTSSFGTNTINDVTYGQGMFVAVGANGRLATSTDGITWTQTTSSFVTNTINDVTYGQGMFVAVGNNDRLATSANIH